MSDTVLVTGGAGYIGSHVSKALAESGVIPVCYDTLEKGHDWAVRWGPLELGDIGDAARLQEVFLRYKPTAIVHMAAYAEVGESLYQAARYMHNNVTKTGVLVDAAMRQGIKTFVFSSTCSVYGLSHPDLLDEKHPIAPMNPYAKSKARAESLLAAAATHGLRSVSLRYFNAAGADSGGDIGEAHTPETHLLPLAADAVLGLGPPLMLLGDDYPTPDGSCVRDFVHVTDLADAHIRALDWLTKKPERGMHEAFNLGSGCGYSVRQAMAEIARIYGRPVPHSIGPRRHGDPPQLIADIKRSKRDLAWQPTRDLSVQIEDTLRWRQKMPR